MNNQPTIQLAPFQGVTGSAFREVYTQYFTGVDKLFTPFFTSIHKQKSLSGRAKEIEQLDHHGIPTVPQVLSKDADEIIRFATYCEDKGFTEINWNLGCPFPRVANKKRGSGMLPYPDLANEILDKVFSGINIKFSIKCRLGYENANEITHLLPVFNAFPLSELIVHARLGKQIYKGEVDLVSFENLIGQSQTPLVYNGDIFSVDDYDRFDKRFEKINVWMIGRGLLYDPFLPGDIKSLYNKDLERSKLIRHFVENLYLAYRKQHIEGLRPINMMKEFWEYLAVSFDDPHKVFNLIKKTKSLDEYEDAVARVFDFHQWVGSTK